VLPNDDSKVSAQYDTHAAHVTSSQDSAPSVLQSLYVHGIVCDVSAHPHAKLLQSVEVSLQLLQAIFLLFINY
jgi:hypothetical protein